MERFTDKNGRKKPMTSSVEAYKKLAAYESTGITPEQLHGLLDIKKNCKTYLRVNGLYNWETDQLEMLADWENKKTRG